MDEPFLRAERHRRLGLRIELDAEALLIQLAHGGPQVRQPAARRVAVVARQQRSLAQLLDGDLRRRDVGVAEAEVDHVLARAPQLELQALDFGEGIGRERVYAAKLRHAADRRRAPSISRTATTSPITTRAGVGRSRGAAPIAPSGAVTTCSRSVVPARDHGGGRSGREAVLDQPLGEPADDRAAHEGDERARDARQRGGVELLDVVRGERGHGRRDAAVRDRDADRLGHRRDRRHARHELERHARIGERERFLAAAPEDERVAALQANDATPVAAVHDEQLVHVVLLESSRAMRSASAGASSSELLCDEPVVDEHLARTQIA